MRVPHHQSRLLYHVRVQPSVTSAIRRRSFQQSVINITLSSHLVDCPMAADAQHSRLSTTNRLKCVPVPDSQKFFRSHTMAPAIWACAVNTVMLIVELSTCTVICLGETGDTSTSALVKRSCAVQVSTPNCPERTAPEVYVAKLFCTLTISLLEPNNAQP